MSRGLVRWNQFAPVFLEVVRGLDAADFKRFWDTVKDRTEAYLRSGEILKRIGSKLDLEFGKEYLHIDGHFRYPTGHAKEGFPEIFIEVENVAAPDMNEVEKLCYVRSPLKLLITVARWSDEDTKHKLREAWRKSIERSWNDWLHESSETVYGFIIGEAKYDERKKEGLYFHLFAISPKGDVLVEETEEFIREF